MFFDIHSHLLPETDDGSSSLEESIKLLEIMKSGGTDAVAVTPHFYAESENLEHYLETTDSRFELLQLASGPCGLPMVKGYEVKYFSGMSVSDSLRRLTLGGSDYILVELPYSADITQKMMLDIENIYYNFGITPILAHLERYVKYHGFRYVERMIDDGIAMGHVNAASLFDGFKGIALKLLESEMATLIASDAHSVATRPPLTAGAFKYLRENGYGVIADRMIAKSEQLYLDVTNKAGSANNII